MNDHDLIKEIELLLADELGHYMEQLGTKTLIGRIFGILVAQSRPLSLTEIAEKLNVSKPAVSTTVKYGLHINLFRKVYNHDYPREDFYEVGTDFIELMIDPGIQKLSYLLDYFDKARRKLEENTDFESSGKELKDMHKRLVYLVDGFRIYLDEYARLGDIIKDRLKNLRKELDL